MCLFPNWCYDDDSCDGCVYCLIEVMMMINLMGMYFFYWYYDDDSCDGYVHYVGYLH